MRVRRSHSVWTAPLAIAISLWSVSPSLSETFESLTSKGYKPSALIKSGGGNSGWKLTAAGKQPFFCRMRGGMVYIGKSGLGSVTTSGRMLRLDRKVTEKQVGGHDPSISQWEDLKAGRLRPGDARECSISR